MNVSNASHSTKVPAVTLGFWFIKIFATTLGEVGGNAVTTTLGLGYLVGTLIFGAALVAAVGAQIKAQRFHPFLYWAAITATTLAGTTLADLFRSLDWNRISRRHPDPIRPCAGYAELVEVVARVGRDRNRNLTQGRSVLLADDHVFANARYGARRLDGRQYGSRL
jgi:hypothetical protein